MESERIDVSNTGKSGSRNNDTSAMSKNLVSTEEDTTLSVATAILQAGPINSATGVPPSKKHLKKKKPKQIDTSSKVASGKEKTAKAVSNTKTKDSAISPTNGSVKKVRSKRTVTKITKPPNNSSLVVTSIECDTPSCPAAMCPVKPEPVNTEAGITETISNSRAMELFNGNGEPANTTEARLQGNDHSNTSRQNAQVIQSAASFFPHLPDDANIVDRAIFKRLAETWDTEAHRWTKDMKSSFVEHLPRARITKTTSHMSNHNIHKLLRKGELETNWGCFIILRVIFGPWCCGRQMWFPELERKYPLASEPAFDGLIPENINIVLDGKAEYNPPEKKKIPVRQLSPHRRMRRKRRVDVDDDDAARAQTEHDEDYEDEEGNGNEDDDEEDNSGVSDPQKRPCLRPTMSRARGAGGKDGRIIQNTIRAVTLYNPQQTMAALKKKYNEQLAKIEELQKSNRQISRALVNYKDQVGLLHDLQMKIGGYGLEGLESEAQIEGPSAVRPPRRKRQRDKV